MANPTQPDLDAIDIATAYATILLAVKTDSDGAGNPVAELPESLIPTNFTAGYGNAVDDLLLQLLRRTIGTVHSADENGLREAVSDGARTVAIQAAITSAAASGAAVVIPAGDWTFNTQIVNPTAVPIVCVGTLVFTGSGEDAIVIGSAASAVQYASSTRSVLRVRRSTIDWTDAFAGVSLVNVFEGRFAVRVEQCETGLRLTGDGTGCVHNHIQLQRMYDNLIAVDLVATGSGWVNQNIFEGGRIGNSSSSSSADAIIGFRLEDDTTAAGPNGNKFDGTSIELSNVGAGYSAAFRGVGAGPISANKTDSIRFETTRYLLAGTALIDNHLNLAFGFPNPALSADILIGDTSADQLDLQRNRFSSARAIGSSEPQELVRFGANNIVQEGGSNVTRPARGVVFLETTGSFFEQAPGSRDGDGVTISHASFAMGFVLDMRNASRDFERSVWLKANVQGTGGRFVALPFDAAFAHLTGADAAGPMNPYGNGGIDFFRTGADMTAENSEIQVAIGDSAAYLFVGIVHGTASPVIRDFTVEVLPNSGITLLQDATIYDALSTGSGTASVDTDDAVSDVAPDAPAANTDYPIGMMVRDSTGATGGWRWSGTSWETVGVTAVTVYPPFNMSMATNAARFLPWGSENAEGAGITFGTRFIVPFDATITGFVVRSSGSLIPGVCTFQVTDAAEVAIGSAGSVNVLANDTTYQTGAMSIDVDANTTIGVDFDPTTSPSGEVMGHMILEPR